MSFNRELEKNLITASNHLIQVSDRFIERQHWELGNRCVQQLALDSDLCQQNPEATEFYKKITKTMIAKLYRIFETFKASIPYQRPALNVLSLACGMPVDFLAFKTFLENHNPGCNLTYTGLDVDADNNTDHNYQLKNYSNCKVLDADCSRPTVVKQVLTANNRIPEDGYDIIFLRHPRILSSSDDFYKMLQDVIPFLAGEKTLVYISAFNPLEVTLIEQAINTPFYLKPANGAFLKVEGCISFPNEHDVMIEPELYSEIRYCNGFALDLDKFTAHQKLLTAIKYFDTTTSIGRKILTAIDARDYNLAVRTASYTWENNWLSALLDHRQALAIDTNASSARNGYTALDWATTIKPKNTARQQATVNLLIQHGAKKAADLATSSAPRPH